MLVVALLAVSFAVGCGGDGGGGSSDTSSTTEWAQGFCSAISDWTDSVSSATGSLKGENLRRGAEERGRRRRDCDQHLRR
jgi:hypothetical protein